MKTTVIAVAVLVLLAGAGGAVWFVGQNAEPANSASSPRADAGTVKLDWFLTEGELLQGTDDISVPEGTNVQFVIDSDAPGQLEIEGYELAIPIEVGISEYTFNAYQSGTYGIRHQPGDRLIGQLSILAAPAI